MQMAIEIQVERTVRGIIASGKAKYIVFASEERESATPTRAKPESPDYSERSAAIGSMRMARLAGT